ncbi:ABC transporter permease [Emticicia sp. 21SJ11W-3]|uniref:ABC transporter permease n=1 Tax=Emticicia sp. 21SJ11W-3 TaxID=2916755 RepID=UPI0020A0B260|nr:ABC transporter permease [Emticicia sp. 21SJ11W-3]UTA67411.1 ABC transporter permease [Emticicia sp. 21SJ11W-3]
MLKNYFKIAIRNLFRNKVYSFINIAGLSIGLAAAMLIMLYTKDEVSYDRFHANQASIYRVTTEWINPDGNVKQSDGVTGYFQGPKFKAGVPEIQSFMRLRSDFRNIRQGNEIKGYELLAADANFFSVFSFPLLSGNPKTALIQPNTLVISEQMAERLFKTKDVMGKTIDFVEDNKLVPYQITGVAKKAPQNSSIKFDFLLPLVVENEEYQNSDNWFNFFLNTFVVLKPHANVVSAEAKMKRVYEADAKESIQKMAKEFDVKENARYALQPLADMHLSTTFAAQNGLSDASNPTFSYILTGIAIFILLIACINFINLTVARSLKRAKEIGIRKVVGGDRKQLIFQFLGESSILCLIAFVLAVFIVQMVLPTFNQLANKSLAFSYLFDIRLISAYVILFAITSLLAGFYPALVLSGYDPVRTLYSRFNLTGKNYLQKTLVVVQFSLASFLIIATMTIYSQFNYLTTKELGYDDKNLILVDKWLLTHSQSALFINELKSDPNIIEVAPKNAGSWGTIAKVNGDTQIDFAYETVNHVFLPLMKIPVLKGRNFSPDFPSDSTKSVIVNEAFVKKAGWKNPLGQEVNFYNSNDKYTVIGVVKNHHFNSLSQEIGPQLFTMKPGNVYGRVFIKIKPGSEVASLKHIEKTFKKLFPINSYDFKFQEAENLKNYESEAKWKQIMLFGTALTICISCIGLFGLATLSAEKRTKEIGIRKVLGASVSSIVQLLSSDFLKLVGLSFIFAFPIAFLAAQKWLENYPYRISINAYIFIITAMVTIAVALLTVGGQAIRAALMNPVNSLKAE